MLKRLGSIRKLSSIDFRQNIYGNILVGLSFLSLTFLVAKTFAPDVTSNAETIPTDAGSSLYSASVSTDDLTPISVIPSTEQTVNTGTNRLTYTNACPYGFFISMSASSDNPDLERQGEDSSSKTIPTITSGNALSDNTWGYSLDNGETYSPIPTLSSPVTIINNDSSVSDPTTLDITYGVKINNDVTAGNYSKDIVYTVAVRPQCIVYTLKWDLNSGTGAEGASYNDSEVNYGRTLDLQNYKPTRNGYDFAGWKSSATGNTFAADTENVNVNPTNALEVTLTAQWTAINYPISYTLNGGSATNPSSYTIETNTITLNNPTRSYYNFAGWTGSNGSTKQTTVTIPKGSTGDKSYTANWTPVNYTLSYTLNGGSATNPSSYNVETATFTLNNPTRNGYTFAGWTGSNGSTKQTSVSIAKGSNGNKSYTANWTAVNYSISYTMNGGSCSSPKTSYTIETATFTLCTPTRNGYNFAGWTGSNGSTKQTSVSIAKGSTGNKSYTANWTAVNYSISYTLNSGSVSGNPTSYNIETASFTLKNPTRDGYTFAGWSGTGISGKSTSVTVSKGSTGNRSYTANWTAICASGTTAGVLNLAKNGQKNYAYSGRPVCEVVKNAGKYKLEVWGAQGGSVYGTGGLGGYSVGTLTVAAQKPLYIYVGSQPSSTAGGWNGGGSGSADDRILVYGSGGGGASDIRYNGTALGNRVIVAGGGGGGVRYVSTNTTGATGGGTTSGRPQYVIYYDQVAVTSGNIGSNQSGTVTNSDTFNFNCDGTNITKALVDYGSAGNGAQNAGGGYYGGSHFGNCNLVYSGSGGSGYVGGVSGGSTTAGQRSGNGYARITYLGT